MYITILSILQTSIYLIIALLLILYTQVFLRVQFLALYFSPCILSLCLPLLTNTLSYIIHLLMTYSYRCLLPQIEYLSYLIIIIMGISKCYFSGEHIALSFKKKQQRCEHRIRKNQQIKSTVHGASQHMK